MSFSSGARASALGMTLGEYEVLALLGRGAMGTVYLARDVALNRSVALKVLLGNLAAEPEHVKALHMEAQAAAPLRHPNIVQVYSAGIDKNMPFIAMEYVEGEPLDRFLRRKRALEWQNALHIGAQIAEALDCAHSHGIIHRDIKPSNILLDRNGRVRLTDFGIAKARSEAEEGGVAGAFLGTPQYMSPEQCSAQPLTPASDLFSLGVLLYQMISGKLPFEGESSMAIIRSIMTDDPTRLDKFVFGVPDDVSRLVAFLMEKEPEKRPSSAGKVVKLIANLQEQKGGVSALPEALTQFLKEQAEPHAPKVAGRRTPVKTKPAAQKRRKRKRRGIQWRRLARGATLAACCVFVILIFHREAILPGAPPGAPPELSIVSFRPLSPGVTRVRLRAPAYRLSRLQWTGNGSGLLAHVAGRAGTLTQGAAGAFILDPDTEQVRSLRAPAGPGLDARMPRYQTQIVLARDMSRTRQHGLLGEAILLYSRALGWGDTPHALAFSQRVDEVAPRSDVLFTTPARGWLHSRGSASSEPGALEVALAPDGYTFCTMLYDPDEGANYLVERDIRWQNVERVGPRLTSPGRPIVANSFQYTPDGKAVIYLREAEGGRRELWRVASGGTELDGTPLAVGSFTDVTAISPDGLRVVVGVSKRGRQAPTLRLLDAREGTLVTDLGEAYISHEPWHPIGAYLLVLQPPRSVASGQSIEAPDQVWAIETHEPYRRRQLTHLKTPILSAPVVAPDGTRAAVILEDNQFPTLALIDISVLS